MVRSLIAVVSCHKRKEWQDAIRSTWFHKVPEGTDVKFFIGRGESQYAPGEVMLDCDDSYQGLPEKVQSIVRWALAEGYDYVLKLDDDVVLNPKAMLESDYRDHPYVGVEGHRPTPQRPYTVPSGFAYWMNKKCMELVAKEPLPSDNYDEGWVAGILHAHGIDLTNDPRYYIYLPMVRNTPPRFGRVPTRLYIEPVDGTFAWCPYFEPNGGTKYSLSTKIEEFKKVFAAEVAVKL